MIDYALKNNSYCDGVKIEYNINGKNLMDVASSMRRCVALAFQEQYYKNKDVSVMVDGLAYVAAYLFIPYGEVGLNYVKEKIYPLTIDAFLLERAKCLLEKTRILNDPKHQMFVLAAYEYCESFSEKVLPFNPVSLTILSARLESELIKSFTITDYSSTPKNIIKSANAFIEHKLRYFHNIKENRFPSIEFDFHLSQLMKEPYVTAPFEFNEKHRREIDGLPIFTFLYQ